MWVDDDNTTCRFRLLSVLREQFGNVTVTHKPVVLESSIGERKFDKKNKTRFRERRCRFRLYHVDVLTNVIFVMCQNLRVESQNSSMLLHHRQLRHFASFPLSESTHWADSVLWNVHFAMGFWRLSFVRFCPHSTRRILLRGRWTLVKGKQTRRSISGKHTCTQVDRVASFRRDDDGDEAEKKKGALFSYFSVRNCGLRHLQSTHPTAQQLSHRVAALVECVCMVHLILWTSSTAIASIVETKSRDLALKYVRFVVSR